MTAWKIYASQHVAAPEKDTPLAVSSCHDHATSHVVLCVLEVRLAPQFATTDHVLVNVWQTTRGTAMDDIMAEAVCLHPRVCQAIRLAIALS